MLKLCICDDQPGDLERLEGFTAEFFQSRPDLPALVETFRSPFDLLERLEEKGGFDIYLLDILMPHLSGLELARKLRERGETAQILFLTSSREYALDAFAVNAAGYLLKPVEREAFFQAVTAAAQALERTATDARSRQYLAALDQSVCRMLRIVGRLELSGRLGGEGGSVRLENALIDLAQLTRELGERLGQLLAFAGVELRVSAPEWMGALADQGLIRQMLMELVSNAAKAGGHVSLALAEQGRRAVFTVEDDGPGVDPERLSRLFSGEEGGVPDWHKGGVGAAIARRVADLHGGTLVADCAPGKGLRVTVSIPLGTPGGTVCRTPEIVWDRGGFGEELIALSDLLPVRAFGPGDK